MRGPHRRARTAAALAVGVVDLVLVVVLMLADTVRVQTQVELDRVALGLPLPWVTQAQPITPPLPWVTGFASPWENPTTIGWLPLVADLVVVGLPLAALWLGVRAVRARRPGYGLS